MSSNSYDQARIPSGEKRLGEYFPSRFIKAEDLLRWNKTQHAVTISRAQEEKVMPKPNTEEWKLVLYFKGKNGEEYPRGYLISSKADVETLDAMGVETVSQLSGLKIVIKLSQFRGKAVLRLAAPGSVA